MPPRAEPLSESTDEALAARVGTCDIAALALLYDRYNQPVYTMAAHTLGRQEAEDVVQDVFLRLWQHASQFDHHRGPFSPWFFAIARHEVIARLRRRGRARQREAAKRVDDVLSTLAEPGPGVEEVVWKTEQSEAVRQALQGLPPEQSQVLTLAYFGGLSQSAIADTLSIPLGTVKKRVRLGLQKMRRTLDPPISHEVDDPAAVNGRRYNASEDVRMTRDDAL